MRIRRWSLTVVACLAVFAALALFKVSEIRAAMAFAASFPEQSETVETVIAKHRPYQPKISVIGEIIAPKRLDLHNELAGELVSVGFVSGAEVEKGQLLLQLDTRIETAQLASAKAQAALAESMYARAESLYTSKAVSKERLDQAKADLAQAKANIDVLQRTIEKKTLRAPFDGQAGLHVFEVGQYLMENTFITTLIGKTENTWLDFKVPQFYPRLKRGTELSVSLIGRDTQSAQASATIIAENTVLDANNRSLFYRASLPNQANFLPQTMVNVAIPIADVVNRVALPSVAIQYDKAGAFVYSLKANKDGKGFRAERKDITLITTLGETAIIESGVSVGERIATAGAFKLYPGLLVFSAESGALE